MNTSSPAAVRLTPELQADYQNIYNDPARRGTPAWQTAAKGLVAAGVIEVSPDDLELRDALAAADASTEQQTL